MCSASVGVAIEQSRCNEAAQSLIMPKAKEGFSFYCRMCQKAAHSNGNLATPAQNSLINMLQTMRNLVYENLRLIRDALTCESVAQQQLSQMAAENMQTAEWTAVLLTDAVVNQTHALTQLQHNAKQLRQIGDAASQILEETAHVYE